MASAESKPHAPLSGALDDAGSMARTLEDGNGKALAQLGSAQNQGDAYGDSNNSGSSLLRRIIDTIPALAWCAMPDGSIEFLNKQWLDYTGLSPAEARDFGYQAAFHPDDRKSGAEKCRELFSGNRPAESEIRVRGHDGIYRWFLVRVEPFRDEAGKIVRWYGTSTDIETLKQTEEKLREEERDLPRITDSIPQAIVVQDPFGATLYANRATLDYTGLAMEDVLKPNFRERIFHPDDIQRLSEHRTSALARGVPFEIEQRALGTDGQYRWFLIRYNPFRDEQGQIVRWYATGTDIDDRKRNEERTRNENSALREEFDQSLMFEEIVGSLGGRLKTGQRGTPQNRPTETSRTEIVIPHRRSRGNDFLHICAVPAL